jgi:hypothetical protein
MCWPSNGMTSVFIRSSYSRAFMPASRTPSTIEIGLLVFLRHRRHEPIDISHVIGSNTGRAAPLPSVIRSTMVITAAAARG